MNTAVILNTLSQASLATTIDLDNILKTFIASLDIKPISREVYTRALRQFFTWTTAHQYQINTLASAQIIQYKEHLLAEGKSALTVAAYLNAVRQFYTWAEGEKIYPNIAAKVKAPKRAKKYRKEGLHPLQVKELLDAADKLCTLRDQAILQLLLRTGLRTIELTRANIGDITFIDGRRVLKVHGKGRSEKDSFVILTDKAFEPIAAYLRTRTYRTENDPLFVSSSNNSAGQRLTTRTISFVAKEILRTIGIDLPNYTAHSFRHTAALAILRGGGTLEDVQFTLRHSNPATTQIYTATLDQERRLANSGESKIDSLY